MAPNGGTSMEIVMAAFGSRAIFNNAVRVATSIGLSWVFHTADAKEKDQKKDIDGSDFRAVFFLC